MKPIAQIYREFYGLDLSLLENGDICARALRDSRVTELKGSLAWLRENKGHVVERLGKERWQ